MRTLSILPFVAMLCLAGCKTPSAVGEHYGEAVRANQDAMIVNPTPSREAVEGLDPRSAEHVLDNYSKGQKAQKHPRARGKRGTGILVGEIK